MHIYIIGTGPGNPDLLTGQAKAAIAAGAFCFFREAPGPDIPARRDLPARRLAIC